MKRLFLLGVLLVLTMSSWQATAANEQLSLDIQKQLELPENKIDIGLAALTFAKEFYPNLDVSAYSKKIDLLVEKVGWLSRVSQDPERRIRALNTVLFLHEKYSYDRSPTARNIQENYFLNGILDRKLGICYTMPLLYMAVAQRLGYPIYAVTAPDHMFLRYADPLFIEQNIETTNGGKFFPDAHYVKKYCVSNIGLRSGSYMRTMSYHEFVGQMFAANAFFHSRKGNPIKVILYLEKVIQCDPRFAAHYDNMARVYRTKSQTTSGDLSRNYAKKAQQYAAKSKALGFVNPEEITIGRRTRGK